MSFDRMDAGPGFRVGTNLATSELVVRLTPDLAHAVGAFLWKRCSELDLFVDDPRVIFAAALCNLSEYMRPELMAKPQRGNSAEKGA